MFCVPNHCFSLIKIMIVPHKHIKIVCIVYPAVCNELGHYVTHSISRLLLGANLSHSALGLR